MPRTADKTDIPHRLSAAGYALFNQQGYNATGIQQITDQAGVPKGSFYNHFESKEVFAAQIIRHYAGWVDEAWDKALQDAPAQAVEAIRHLFLQFVHHHEAAGCQGCLVGNFAAEVAESSLVCRAVLANVLHNWRERLATLIEAAQAGGQLRADIPAQELSGFVWDAWEGAVLRMKIEHRTDPLKEVLNLMLDKLLRPPSPSIHAG